MGFVGRKNELDLVQKILKARRHVLIEGPVGVGKTVLARQVAQDLKRELIRIDGDGRYTEQKLTGWFDPARVLKLGYSAKTFVDGPLSEAMRKGAILLINELNRLPEGVQNVLLPSIDEGILQLPRLGALKAAKGFAVIATQNPREFVGTSHLSEALLDRFELIKLDYPSFEEELEIVRAQYGKNPELARWSVELARRTRVDSRVRRGASVRASLSVMGVALQIEIPSREAFAQAAQLALPTRIEVEPTLGHGVMADLIKDLVDDVLLKRPMPEKKSPKFS